MERTPGERTAAVHGPDASRRGSLVTPIHQTSTFVLESAQDVDDVYDGRRAGDVYSRYTNPSLAALERRLAQLEGTQDAQVMASGMGALSASFLALVGAGGRIVANEDLYGGTFKLLGELSRRFGVRVDTFPSADTDALRALLREPADLVFVETPTNPTLRLVDIQAAAEAARAAGAVSLVDSTFASPINSRPHALGADLVMHSATKYLGGHSDLTAGVVCGTRELVERVRAMHRLVGAVLDPHTAFLVERSLKTLPLRVEAANANGMRVAQFLASHPAVRAVHYPGLPTHPQHELARRQMRGFGGLLSFDAGSFENAKRVLDGLRLVKNAASLGGVESLCSLPLQQSHRHQPPQLLARSGIAPGTVRLALGVEDGEDIVADLEQALAPLAKG